MKESRGSKITRSKISEHESQKFGRKGFTPHHVNSMYMNSKMWLYYFQYIRRSVRYKYGAGFTLIELIVVISIIGILATFLFSNFVNSQQRGRDQQRKTDLQNIRTSLESIKLDTGRYPSSLIGCGATLSVGSNVYMRNFACDPSYESGDWNGGQYFYCTDTFSYAVFACLENTSDPDVNAILDPSDPSLNLPSGCSVPTSCSKYYYLSNI